MSTRLPSRELVAALLTLCSACREDPQPAGASPSAPPVAAAATATAAATAKAAASAQAWPSGSPEAGPACPSFEASRWRRFQPMEPPHECDLQLPANEGALLPIEWEPCRSSNHELGTGCRQLKLPPGETLNEWIDSRSGYVPSSAGARLAFGRSCGDAYTGDKVWVAFDVDGPFVGGLAFAARGLCQVRPALTGAGWGASLALFSPDENQLAAATVVGARGQLGARSSHEGQLADAISAGSTPEPPSLRRYRDRPEPLLDPGSRDQAKKPHVTMASDGKDLVWTYEAPGGGCMVATSAMSEDPARLAPMRLAVSGCPRFHLVGCGHAFSDDADLLVRLRDGVSWSFEPACDMACLNDLKRPECKGLQGHQTLTDKCPNRGLAITCDELFMGVGGLAPTIYRIQLSKLQHGRPPREPVEPLWTDADAGTAAPDGGGSAGEDGGAAIEDAGATTPAVEGGP